MTEIDRLCDSLAASGIAPRRMLRDEPMARHTTFRVGGPADVLISSAWFFKDASFEEKIKSLEIVRGYVFKSSNTRATMERYATSSLV